MIEATNRRRRFRRGQENNEPLARAIWLLLRRRKAKATLKFWHPEANRIRLQPANSKMSPIYVKEASVLGIVVGVVRNMI